MAGPISSISTSRFEDAAGQRATAGSNPFANQFGDGNDADIVSMSLNVNVNALNEPAIQQRFHGRHPDVDPGGGGAPDRPARPMAGSGLGTIYVRASGNNRDTSQHRDAGGGDSGSRWILRAIRSRSARRGSTAGWQKPRRPARAC